MFQWRENTYMRTFECLYPLEDKVPHLASTLPFTHARSIQKRCVGI